MRIVYDQPRLYMLKTVYATYTAKSQATNRDYQGSKPIGTGIH
jgi:hypothetical protein